MTAINEKEVSRLLQKWQRRLGLYDWEFDVTIYHKRKEVPKKLRRANAWIRVFSGYSFAELYINGWRISRSSHNLDRTISHELVHVLLDRLAIVVRSAFGEQQAEAAQEMIESATEQVSRALLRR